MRTLLALTAVLGLAYVTLGQPGPGGGPPPMGGPGGGPPGIGLPPGAGGDATGATLDQVLQELEQVRAQKAELAKRESNLIGQARKLMDTLQQRGNKLGLFPEVGPGTPGGPGFGPGGPGPMGPFTPGSGPGLPK